MKLLEIPITSVTMSHPRLVAGDDTPGYEIPSLEGLTASIKALGQLVPAYAIKHGEGWALLDGNRRYHAALLAGRQTFWIVDCGQSNPAIILALQLHAPELPRNRAEMIARLRASYPPMSIEDIALKAGLSETSIQRYVDITRNLERRIYNAWSDAPGAFTLRELEMAAMMSAPRQNQWFERHYLKTHRPEHPEPSTDTESTHTTRQVLTGHRMTGKLTRMREAIIAGAFDHQGDDWKRGALAVFDWIEAGVTPEEKKV